MVITFYGTGAELIKMYGIIKAMPRDEQLLICTAQQFGGLQKVHKQLDIHPDLYLSDGWKKNDVANMKQMMGLIVRVNGAFLFNYRTIKKMIRQKDKQNNTKSIVLVHGDTITTVIGAYMGRMLGLPVAHVEAGLRSGSWKSPFPEEIDRRIVTKIARTHFAPNDLAEKNLRNERAKGDIINTGYNTAKDAIEQADKFTSDNFLKLQLPKNYSLVLLHRTELLENRNDFESILKTINNHAKNKNHVVFTMHTTTEERINSYGFMRYLEHPYIRVIHKQPYFDFMAIVKNSECIITDGGGLQEDAYFLGIPVIVHRIRTERQEGIGINAKLSSMDTAMVADFLKSHPHKSSFSKLTSKTSPSIIVVNELTERNFITRN